MRFYSSPLFSDPVQSADVRVKRAENGTTHTLDMEGKWSSVIYQELLDLAAGPWWARWKAEQAENGTPVTPHPPPQKKTGAAAVLP